MSPPHAGLRRSLREGPDVSASLALAAKRLPSGLRRESVQPGPAWPLCKTLILSLLFPALQPRASRPGAGRGCGCLCPGPGEGPAPGSRPYKANEGLVRSRLFFFFCLKVHLGLNLIVCFFNSIFLSAPPNFMCIYEYTVTAKFLAIYSHLKLPAAVRKEEHIFGEGKR